MRSVQVTIACTKGERERERERENSNSKTLFYKDCSLGSEKEREVGHTSINTTDNGKEIFQC